jgi:cytochrome c biogenesis protein CcdA
MLGSFSVVSLSLGVGIALLGDHYPSHRRSIEVWAGVLLIAGLAALGCALGLALGPPL